MALAVLLLLLQLINVLKVSQRMQNLLQILKILDLQVIFLGKELQAIRLENVNLYVKPVISGMERLV